MHLKSGQGEGYMCPMENQQVICNLWDKAYKVLDYEWEKYHIKEGNTREEMAGDRMRDKDYG